MEEEGRREGERKQCEDGSRGQPDTIWLPLKKDKGTRGQGGQRMLVSATSWKRQVDGFSLETIARNTALLTS